MSVTIPTPTVEPTPSVTVEQVRARWDEILLIVSRRNRKSWALVREANVRAVKGDTVVLLFKHAGHAVMLNNSPDALTDALAELLGGSWKVNCGPNYVTPAPATPEPTRFITHAVPKKITPTPAAVRPIKISRSPRRWGRNDTARPAEQLPSIDPIKPATPIVPCAGVRCAVYLHYDADDVLLYVGMSVAPSLRTGQHAEGSSWVDFAVRGEIVWFGSEAEAKAREAELIRSLGPPFNVAHAAPGTDRRLVEYLAEKKRYELLLPKVRKG